jgi:aminomethyltransferase
MSSVVTAPVKRRSALEARHAALGAKFVDVVTRWPLRYGDERAEARAVATTAGLAELGPFAELLLRGPGVAAVLAAITDSPSPARDGPRVLPVTVGTGRGEAWSLAPDEALLLRPVEGEWPVTLASDGRRPDGVSTIELTGGHTVLRLAGPAAPDIMAELCPVDTTPRALGEGQLIQAPVVGVRAIIAQRDCRSDPGYIIRIARDHASNVWDAVLEIGAAHGVSPVGPAAMQCTGAAVFR